MKHALVAALAVLAGVPAAIAAEQDFSSPYDRNRHCAERTTDGNAPECVIQEEGVPRQTYPPAARPVVPNRPPQTPPTAGAPPITPPGTTSATPSGGTTRSGGGNTGSARSGAAGSGGR